MTGRSDPSRSRAASRGFWAMLGLLVLVSLGLTVAARLNAPPAPAEIPSGLLSRLAQEAASVAETRGRARLEQTLDAAFAEAHAAVPAYADFHYSVIGEYAELGQAALGTLTESAQARLFAGVEARLAEDLPALDAAFQQDFRRELAARLDEAAPSLAEGAPLAAASRAAMDDTLARARASLPLAAVAATGAGVAGAKLMAAGLAKGVAKLAAKTAAKTAAKGSGALGGAGAGAALGAALGPVGAAVGGAAGAVVAWVAVDYAVVKADEALNRDGFEAELHALIEAERAALEVRLLAALAERTRALGFGETSGQTRTPAPKGETLRERHRQAEAAEASGVAP